MVADEGVEPPLSGCGPDALPLHQSAVAPPRGVEPRFPVSETGVLSVERWRHFEHLDQDSNLECAGRSRVHCPLCYRGMRLRQDSNPHRPGRSRLSCPLDDGCVEHHQGLEPCRSGLQPDLLSLSCGAKGQGTEELNLASSRFWRPASLPRACHKGSPRRESTALL